MNKYAKYTKMMRLLADRPYTVNPARIAAERQRDMAMEQHRKQQQGRVSPTNVDEPLRYSSSEESILWLGCDGVIWEINGQTRTPIIYRKENEQTGGNNGD